MKSKALYPLATVLVLASVCCLALYGVVAYLRIHCDSLEIARTLLLGLSFASAFTQMMTIAVAYHCLMERRPCDAAGYQKDNSRLLRAASALYPNLVATISLFIVSATQYNGHSDDAQTLSMLALMLGALAGTATALLLFARMLDSALMFWRNARVMQ